MRRFLQQRVSRWRLPMIIGVALLLFVQSMVFIKSVLIEKKPDVWEAVADDVAESEPTFTVLGPDDVGDRLVSAIIEIESGGDPRAVGAAGERGLMQIMPDTWADMTLLKYGDRLSFDLAFVPELNEEIGRFYLHYLQTYLHRHHADWQSDERTLLLAAYNGGPNRLAAADFDVRKLPRTVREYALRGSRLHDQLLADQAPYIRQLLMSADNLAAAGDS